MSSVSIPPGSSSASSSEPRVSNTFGSLYLAMLLLVEGILLGACCPWQIFAADSWLWAELAHRCCMYATSLITVALLFAGIRQQPTTLLQRDPCWLRQITVLVQLGALLGFLIATVIIANVVPWERPGWIGIWLSLALTMFAGAALLVFRVHISNRIGDVLAGLAIVVMAHQASSFTGKFWEPLSAATLLLVDSMLRLIGMETMCDPAALLVGTPAFSVKILPPCCGYQGIGLVCVFTGAYLFLGRRELRFPQALLLLPLAVLLSWLANVLRISFLILVGVYVSPQVAVNGFHSQAGWLMFNLVAICLIGAGRTLPLFSRVRERAEGVNLHAAYLAPFLLIVLTGMIGKAFTQELDVFYPVRVMAAGAALWCFRHQLRSELRWSFSWEALSIGAVVFCLWMLLEPASATMSPVGMELAALPPLAMGAWAAFRMIGAVVTVPIAEELAFRGYLPRRLLGADFTTIPLGVFTVFTFLISSVVFGMLHGRWFAGTLAGMLYALALCRRGKLCDAITAHATTNALIAIHVCVTGRWDMW